MLKPRECIASLPPYQSPITTRAGLNLDLNENTGGCSPRVLARLRELSTLDLARYPAREPGEQTVAKFLCIKPEQVLLTNGLDEALQLLFAAYLGPGAELIFAEPSFVMYPIVGAATGARLVRVRMGEDFAYPTGQVLAGISSKTRLIAIANPDNPSGTTVAREDLLRILDAAPHAAVLIDEAYFEFYGETMLGELPRHPNLFVARTFSKAYGLAGLRIGVLAGAPDQIEFLRRFSSPFNMNAAAMACLEGALADREFMNGYVAQVKRGRERLETLCTELGLKFWLSRTNFMLLRVGSPERFVAAMLDRGIVVRDMSQAPGCTGCVRITIPTAAEMDRVLEAIRKAAVE